MKKYTYETVKIGDIFSSQLEVHREIIDKYALEGYRYVGYLPTKIESRGRIMEIDLIFEIDC